MPLIISNGISSSRINRAIAPSFRVRLRFIGFLPVRMGESLKGVCGRSVARMWDLCGVCASRFASRSVLRQAQPDLHPTLDIANAKLTLMQLDHFLDKIEPKPGTLTPAVRTRQ